MCVMAAEIFVDVYLNAGCACSRWLGRNAEDVGRSLSALALPGSRLKSGV